MFRKVKEVIKKNEILYLIMLNLYKSVFHVFNYLKEIPKKIAYKKQIQKILKKNEIIVKIDFGGLGDSLKYSTLPELLKKQYNIDFYLHQSNRDIFRHNDILKLCFMKNPYFKGFKEAVEPFEFKIFQDDNENLIGSYEKHLKLNGLELPKIYYEPQVIHEYENIVLIDTNQVTGLRFGYQYDEENIKIIIANNDLGSYQIEYAEPSKQDLFKYIDMIYSCKYYICFLSGGSVVAAALNKKSSVIIPDNMDVKGRGAYPWFFRKASHVEYIYKGSVI